MAKRDEDSRGKYTEYVKHNPTPFRDLLTGTKTKEVTRVYDKDKHRESHLGQGINKAREKFNKR